MTYFTPSASCTAPRSPSRCAKTYPPVLCGPDDLLMVGSRSYGPFARTLLGSVSSTLIHTAPCPVLVVPRPHHAKVPAELSEPAVAETA